MRNGRYILVADDNAIVRLMTVSILKRQEYPVLEAADGVEALNLTKQTGEIDLLVTDINMPNMNGYELAKRFRELRPNTPIIFLSGDLHAKDAHVGFSPATTILKPPSPDMLVRVVREMLLNVAAHEQSQ